MATNVRHRIDRFVQQMACVDQITCIGKRQVEIQFLRRMT